ncbi:hypothetical protein HAX54_035493, partial [Datura stramonium]|nr:hypothetical protein [Datura stramonium]
CLGKSVEKGASSIKIPILDDFELPPFNDSQIDVNLSNEFTDWVYANVSRTHGRKSAYSKKKNMIDPPFDFGVHKIDKMY